jgi:hypothetical protein|tara:strand:+ start:420 stop:575 length:156 start_codon:yes stop_codon:yes gene_type:complete
MIKNEEIAGMLEGKIINAVDFISGDDILLLYLDDGNLVEMKISKIRQILDY